MICSNERSGNFPFDIRHRHIIKYDTSSLSDFVNLEDTILKNIVAMLQTSKTVDKLNSTPVVESRGLKSHEIAMLVLITENTLTVEDSYSVHILKSKMNKAGYTDISTSVAIKTLYKKGLILLGTEVDDVFPSETYPTTKLTEKGEDWILKNQDILIFRNQDTNGTSESNDPMPK